MSDKDSIQSHETPGPLSQIQVKRKTGGEPFHQTGEPTDVRLLEFWQWSSSDLANNTRRGVLAEFLVARALGVADGHRVEWDNYDVVALESERPIKIEVKSSAYLQSWHQENESSPSFDIAPRQGWEASTNTIDATVVRRSDVYVFALLAHRHKPTLDPMDLSQWAFYVVPTALINEAFPRQKKVSLGRLKRLGHVPCNYNDLAMKVRNCVKTGQQSNETPVQ